LSDWPSEVASVVEATRLIESRGTEAHVSTLASWFWCGKRCILELEGVKRPPHPSLARGSRVYEMLTHRVVTAEHLRVQELLSKFKVHSSTRPDGMFFHRPYKGFAIGEG
jgi:hypothetical protein